ncbi:hypothetical protein FPV67DRAFT_1198503 [Lyophyllum atratum]|nr:hypothetical protein FPV67DRAFT_1198503 [Lyophyllum atratum]
MSDDEANSPATYERETQSQFVPREDDEEVLWEVIEITAEKPKAYKVRWAGVDPKTSKPWAQSWVEKRDCTDDLVLEWKRKQALKKKKEDEKKGNKRSSTKSHASAVSRSALSRGSTVSSSTTTKRSAQRESGSATTARLNKSRKRTHSVAVGDHDGDDLPPHVELAEDTTTPLPVRPNKKRKLDAIRKRSHTTVAAASDSDEPPPALALPDELMPSQPPGPIEQRKVDLTEEFNAESSVEPSSSRLPPPGKRKTKVVRQADEDEDEDQVSRNTKLMSLDRSRPDKGKRKAYEEEEDEQDEVVPVSQPPAKPVPPKFKPKPKANYPAVKQRIPLASSPEPEPGYVKYKSGKVSTPRKRRRALSSVNRSSSSDDVEIGKLNRNRPPTRSPTPPSHSPVISQNGIAQLQAFDNDMIAISAAPVLPKQTENAQAGNSAPAVTVTTKVKRTTVVTRPPNGANSVSPDLYRQGIVPETETESSHNTQSQSLLDSQSQSQSQSQARPQFLRASPSPPPVHVDHQRTADRSTSSPDLPPPIPRPRPVTTHIPVTAPPHTPDPVPEPERRKQEIPLETPASSIHRKLSRVPTLVVPQPSASGQTPMRSSLISKMKPRTPGSSSHLSIFGDDIPGADLAFPGPGLDVHMEVDEEEEQNADIEDDEEKEIEAEVGNVEENGVVGGRRRSRTGSGAMRPLPQLSPSTFAPHLPSGSSAGGVERGAAMDSDEAEVEELVSSAEQIEQFSSPVKVDGKGRGNVAVSVKVDGTGRRWRTVTRNKQTRSTAKRRRPDLDEDLDTDKDTDTDQSVTDRDEERGEELEDLVRVRGEQLAELKRAEGLKRKHEFTGDVGEGKKRTLTELLGKRGRHMQDKERDWEKRRLRQELEAPKVWKEKRKEKQKELEQRDEKEIEMDVLMLRQEEEESTQDLMMDIEMRPMEEAEANTEWGAEAHVQVSLN